MTDIQLFHMVSASERLVEPKTSPANLFVNAEPCIKVGFFFDQRVSDLHTLEVSYDSTLALVDTGADAVYVDFRLIEKYRCPVAVGGDNMTVNAQVGSRAHRGSIFIIEEGRIIDLWVIARDFRSENRPFDIVLGRRFLQFCHLVWDGPRQTVKLLVGENDGAF